MGRCLATFVAMLAITAFAVTSQANLSYRGALRLATHNGRLFNFETWDAKIIWHATFFSDEFRHAFETKHVEVNHLDENDAAQFILDQEYKQKRGWDFIVSFYTKKDYKKFSTDHDSFWKIYLTTESGEVIKPDVIDPIPITPYETVMFSHLNRWSKLYRVTFPKVELGSKFYLTISSVVGESNLRWTQHLKRPMYKERQRAEKYRPRFKGHP